MARAAIMLALWPDAFASNASINFSGTEIVTCSASFFMINNSCSSCVPFVAVAFAIPCPAGVAACVACPAVAECADKCLCYRCSCSRSVQRCPLDCPCNKQVHKQSCKRFSFERFRESVMVVCVAEINIDGAKVFNEFISHPFAKAFNRWFIATVK